jgi:hypothetical protein
LEDLAITYEPDISDCKGTKDVRGHIIYSIKDIIGASKGRSFLYLAQEYPNSFAAFFNPPDKEGKVTALTSEAGESLAMNHPKSFAACFNSLEDKDKVTVLASKAVESLGNHRGFRIDLIESINLNKSFSNNLQSFVDSCNAESTRIDNNIGIKNKDPEDFKKNLKSFLVDLNEEVKNKDWNEEVYCRLLSKIRYKEGSYQKQFDDIKINGATVNEFIRPSSRSCLADFSACLGFSTTIDIDRNR